MRIPKAEPAGSITKPHARGIEQTERGAYRVVRISPEGTARYLSDEYDRHRDAVNDLFQPYAWPGGYPVFWFDCGDQYNRTDSAEPGHLCPRCAKKAYFTNRHIRARMANGECSADVYEGDARDHGAISCEACGAVLFPEWPEDEDETEA